ncbi:MAG: C-GCAxxG-C-C family protein [Oryzomonas sp.]|uniref:C-GCAxxG-C-C family protein n=1 Tax=Oryzomonas sp. TaxID=2855186 RepID=UPI00284F8A8E|nr:C-GCAxxG-C-C family protein [Oryzomonas sp.]MDR3580106.1 C-GCAxxG-C-C family protein [Oryzomonas sp.]
MTTRREALEMIGIATGSVLLGSIVTGCATTKTGNSNGYAVAADGKTPGFPWPYIKLDPVNCAERAYKAFLEGHCMFGSFSGIVGEYAEKMGAPYDSFPFPMMKIGAGGGGDWATLCGSLNGAMLSISLFSRDPKPLVDELFGWYQKEPLPNYHPSAKPRVEITVTSVAKSPLCHVSVSRWCKSAKVKSFSMDRDERCAWMTASVAKKAVELLNAQADGVFMGNYPLPKHVQECRSCHDKEGIYENTRGKMECGTCHFSLGTKHPEI